MKKKSWKKSRKMGHMNLFAGQQWRRRLDTLVDTGWEGEDGMK